MVAGTVAARIERLIDPDAQDGASRNDGHSRFWRFG
jgi:hypothetical protein